MNFPFLLALLVINSFWVLTYGIMILIFKDLSEKWPVLGLKIITVLNLICAFGVTYQVLNSGHDVPLHLGHWFELKGYEFPLDLNFQLEFAPFILVLLTLVSVITKFSQSYLHKESGFHRFFFLLSLFQWGYVVIILSQTIDLFFLGWEIVGTTSVLLISFYFRRESTVQNSLWAISSYRVCDIGLLMASAISHHYLHSADLRILNEFSLYGHGQDLTGPMMVVAFLLVFASLAKSAQLPVTSWIVRAMEGPTPSSALYYGALSVSLGPVLILKFYPLLSFFPTVRMTIVGIGVLTALYVSLTLKTRSDAKSILAYSSTLQMSFVFIELGLGFKWLAIFHVLAHAFVRIFQYLRSLNVIEDFYENPHFLGSGNLETKSWTLAFLPLLWREKLYYLSVNAFGLDWFLLNLLILPWLQLIKKINQLEDRWFKTL